MSKGADKAGNAGPATRCRGDGDGDPGDAAGARTEEVGTAEVGTAEVGTAEVGTAEVGTGVDDA